MTKEDLRRRIDAYIPHKPDTDLDDNQYYFRLWNSDRVIKVYPMDVLPIDMDTTEYLCYQKVGFRLIWVDVNCDGDRFRGANMGRLYDNKQDCKNMTHDWYDDWETLRKAQKEMEIDEYV